jgi:hypothetical protein
MPGITILVVISHEEGVGRIDRVVSQLRYYFAVQ